MTAFFILFTLPAFVAIFIARASKPDRIMSKYLLKDFEKGRLLVKEGEPVQNPCKDFDEWKDYIKAQLLPQSPTN